MVKVSMHITIISEHFTFVCFNLKVLYNVPQCSIVLYHVL